MLKAQVVGEQMAIKLINLLILCTILLIPIAFADVDTNNIIRFNFTDNVLDASGNGNNLYFPEINTDDQITYYNFVDNGDSTDDWGSYDGTDTNMTYGAYGAYFDGDTSEINMGLSPINNTGVFTIHMENIIFNEILNCEGIIRNGIAPMFMLRTIGTDEVRICIYQSDNTLRCADGTYTVLTDTPYNLTFLANGSHFMTYVNGVIGSQIITYDGSLRNSNSGMTIGEYSANNANFTVEKIKFWNRSMTTDEIVLLDATGDTLVPTVVNYSADKNDVADSSIYLNGSEYYKLTSTIVADTTAGASFSFWTNASGGAGQSILGHSPIGRSQIFVGAGVYIESDTNNDWCIGTRTSVNEWHHYVISIDSNVCTIYEDGEDITTDSTITDDVTLSIFGASNNGGTGNFIGLIDEVNVYDRALTEWEAKNLYGMYDYYDLAVDNVPINVFNQTNESFFIDTTATNFGAGALCNYTSNDSLVTCFTDTPPTSACVITPNMNRDVSLRAFCYDDTYGAIYDDNPYVIYVDNVNPTISVAGWETDKVYFQNNVTGNFTFADAYALYSWNVSIDSTQIAGAENVAYDSYIYNLTYNISNLPAGLHTLGLRTADGHTKELIGDYNVDLGGWFDNSYVKFKTGKNNIKIQSKNIDSGDVWSVKKKKDRYSFKYKAKTKIDNPVLVIETEKPLFIVNKPNTLEKIWIISGDNWIDFVNDDKANVSIRKISDNKAEITIYSKKASIEFNSIGELNIVTQEYNFSTVNYTITYSSPVFEQQSDGINLTIDFGQAVDYTSANATLTYNNTVYSATKTANTNQLIFNKTVSAPAVSASMNHTFDWNITFNPALLGDVNDTTISTNQTVYAISIGKCSENPTWTPAINMTFYDETTLEPVAENITMNMDLNVLTSGGVDKKFGFEFVNATYYEICIETSGINYTVDSRIEYASENYTNKKYYLVNYTLTETMETIPLYCLDDTLASDVVLTVFDERDGSRVSDAYVKILRYYPNKYNETSAGYYTTEIELTDQNGQTSGKFILADVWYKFIVEKPIGTILLNSDIQKILSTEVDIPVYTSTDYLSQFKTMQKVSGDVSCTRTTRTCRLTWSDSTGGVTKGELRIYEDNGFAKILTYTASVESTSATLSYVIPNITDRRFIAEGWVYLE